MAAERNTIEVQSERVVLAAGRLPDSNHDPRDPFGELRSLAEQAGAVVVGELSQRLEKPIPATFLGSGKVAELKRLCEALDAKTIIFDHDLSPKQIANIEKETLRKVLDRSELILDIFASRAATSEAKLQVELAQMEYTYPRLKAMWSHLERIVGGIGTRGPGEQQLEIDRRLVQRRKLELQRDLEVIQARKRREVAARKSQHFTVGIVGYTNAGKSTLFNTLTRGGAYADDRLFATLMTRTRDWDLGGGLSVMLSDTVGFVRDIPHHLVASFRATLEEATHADVLLIVLDVSDPAAEIQYKVVTTVLDELEAELKESRHEEDRYWTPPERIILLNKIDRLNDNAEVLVWQRRVPGAMAISAVGGDESRNGLTDLTARIRALALGEIGEFDVTVPLRDARTIHLIETRGHVLDREYTESSVRLRARIGVRQLALLRSAGARLTLATSDGKDVDLAPLPGLPPAPKGWTAKGEVVSQFESPRS
ncbi:MAG: GTPase HflX [Phycisphaerae bacterium]|nr:GTPase HflX [Phycisphaerae bacterium]